MINGSLRTIFILSSVVLLFGLINFGCVRVKTGATDEMAMDSSERQAKDIRSRWYRTIDETSAQLRPFIYQNYMDSVLNVYLDYGYSIVNEWKIGEEGRKEKIEASEMRKVVNSWISNRKPILKAYDDNIEYGLEIITEDKVLSDKSMTVIQDMVNNYYDAYGRIFFPANDVETYERTLEKVRQKNDRINDRLLESVKR